MGPRMVLHKTVSPIDQGRFRDHPRPGGVRPTVAVGGMVAGGSGCSHAQPQPHSGPKRARHTHAHQCRRVTMAVRALTRHPGPTAATYCGGALRHTMPRKPSDCL